MHTLPPMGKPEHRVSLVRCASYDVDALVEQMREALGHMGFDIASVDGKTVLLKPNMLGAYPPHMQVTTHPAFVEAAARLFGSCGARVQVGDSHNGVYETDEVWNVTGIRRATELAGAEIVPFEGTGSRDVHGLQLANAVFDADIVVNLPKFKTHGLTILTCAAKNLFGCVPGMVKTAYHREHIDRRAFAGVVARIAAAVKPALTIIDAITGMDGPGPSAGNPIEMGLIIAGDDVNAVDTVCCRLVDLEPSELDTLAKAQALGSFDPTDAITVTGNTIEACKPHAFELPSTYVKRRIDWPISKVVLSLIWNSMKIWPVISDERCQRCGLCLKSCPVGAIGWRGKLDGDAPRIDEKICIQCFCCHETCPHRAIDLKRSVAARLGQWLGRRNQQRQRKVSRCNT